MKKSLFVAAVAALALVACNKPAENAAENTDSAAAPAADAAKPAEEKPAADAAAPAADAKPAEQAPAK